MNPGYDDDATRRMAAGGHRGNGGPGGYGDGHAADGYATSGYDDRYAEPAPRRGPSVDVGRLAGGVVATAIVAALAGALVAFLISALFERFGHTWANGGNTPVMFAIYGAVAALLAGLLWYLLLVGTPDPNRFFSWIVALLVVAAIALPLLVTVPLIDGFAAALVHLAIGLPILALTSSFAGAARR